MSTFYSKSIDLDEAANYACKTHLSLDNGAHMNTDLFETQEPTTEGRYRPLAVRMRPESLEQMVGQEHILGAGRLLPKLVKGNNFGNIMLYGPPGCGKTTLAEVIAKETDSRFVKINAVLSNVAELRETLKLARYDPSKQTLLFIDEIHRFNKAQQDLLLPDIEEGNIRLIGATTHNPGFYIIPPLLSRSHLFRLEPLPKEDIQTVLEAALHDKEKGLGNSRCHAQPGVLEGIASLSQGDLRRAYNALETIVLSQPIKSTIEIDAVESFAKERQIRYDKEDEHYDTASAYIKSIRGGDPDAALYWLTKMLEGGEDPRFIARRLVILASEDVGLADSRALPLATATFQACEIIGLPECSINLAHATVFLSCSPKSNTAYMGLINAQQAIRSGDNQAVPLWLKDAHTKVNKALGHGKDYLYSHEFHDSISGQEYMLESRTFYHSKPVGAEAAIDERLKQWKKLKIVRQNNKSNQ